MPATQVPSDDRGLAFGDGLFETVLMRAGQPLLWSYHLERLARGCRRLAIPMPSFESLEASFEHTASSELEVLKLVLTRGSGGQGYKPPDDPAPRLLVTRRPFQAPTERWRVGVCVRLCALRLGHQPLLAGIKHLSRLENVLARQEWDDPAIAEGLLADTEGWVVEATSMNIFWLANGGLYTPRLSRCGVAGTLREALIERGVVFEADLTLEALSRVEGLWVANSVQGVWPVHTLLDSKGERLAAWTRLQGDTLQRQGHRLLGYPGQIR
ncbi:aminodeoxychorismate lyase [Vreelandella sp. EE22]